MNRIKNTFHNIKKYLLQLETLGTIYMLHRCSPIDNENLYWNEHMKVSPNFLKNFLKEQKKTCNFISLDELLELPHSRRKKKCIVMTFDDGYRDNYEYALSIFDEMSIPFVVYITNSFPDKTAFLWWYILEDILRLNKYIVLADGRRFDCETKEKKEAVFLDLRQLILNLNQENLVNEFKNMFCNYEIDFSTYNDTLCLTWDMIKEMSNSQWCTIAAHTMNHKALNKLPEKQLDYEIMQSKKELEEHIGKSVNHFAYPFGTFNEVSGREVEFVKKCKLNTVCYSFGGSFTKKNIGKPFELPRQFLGELVH
jgi:peptidoglycan/xylan/chitin deacetylase (PgdA/CDA1 family)